MTDNFLLSIVIPVHNEEDNLSILIKRLHKTLATYRYELIFVDDGSKDQSLNILKKEAQNNSLVKVLSFTRNFGHQNALNCGYCFAKGDCVVTIDADLQDPPEIILELVKKWQAGAEIVYAKRRSRQDSWLKTSTAHLFYQFLNFLSEIPIPVDVGDFRLQDKRVNTYLNQLPEHNKYLRGLVAWGGFREAVVEFDRDKRLTGKTNYTLSKMINLALDGITSFSIKPLRVATYAGFVVSGLGYLGIIYALFIRFFLPHEYWVTGWTALIVAIFFVGGAQLFTIGIIGEYIAKIYREVQNRPPYLIKEAINLDNA
jgi:dolichol-phosphate mannosyltransferase